MSGFCLINSFFCLQISKILFRNKIRKTYAWRVKTVLPLRSMWIELSSVKPMYFEVTNVNHLVISSSLSLGQERFINCVNSFSLHRGGTYFVPRARGKYWVWYYHFTPRVVKTPSPRDFVMVKCSFPTTWLKRNSSRESVKSTGFGEITLLRACWKRQSFRDCVKHTLRERRARLTHFCIKWSSPGALWKRLSLERKRKVLSSETQCVSRVVQTSIISWFHQSCVTWSLD